ncbi:gamma-glutamylcyclotransferase family protein [Singulisphaera sp. Ch08]|uniref:Gamma-glutamylcyclotransferase family protein n=1 Tax=Singulisphaera sp. Ch08 TaxID=3120278 RepID=A0AAU7CPW2_9BACT
MPSAPVGQAGCNGDLKRGAAPLGPSKRTTPSLLFAYGTLAPDDPGEVAARGWVADEVRGRLFDLGPYPALVDHDDKSAGWVEGFVRPVDPIELTHDLDPYEGVDEGLYQRVAVTTRRGLWAWVYIFARPLPREARGPLTRWRGRRALPVPEHDSNGILQAQETTDGNLDGSEHSTRRNHGSGGADGRPVPDR